jgi:hypothetical protein
VHIIVVVVWCSSKLGQRACWLHGYGTVRAVLLYCCIVYMYKQRCLLYLLSFCVGCVDWPVVSAALLHWLTQCCVLHLLFFFWCAAIWSLVWGGIRVAAVLLFRLDWL